MGTLRGGQTRIALDTLAEGRTEEEASESNIDQVMKASYKRNKNK